MLAHTAMGCSELHSSGKSDRYQVVVRAVSLGPHSRLFAVISGRTVSKVPQFERSAELNGVVIIRDF